MKTRILISILLLVALLAGVGLPAAAQGPAVEVAGPAAPEKPVSEKELDRLAPVGGCSPEALWPGPDGYGYVGQVVDYVWVDITGSGTPIVGLTDDNYAGPFPIGFAFNFYGTNWDQFYAGSNGFLSFGAGSTSLSNQCPLPNTTAPNNIIALLWDDLNFNVSGNAYYQYFDTCPVGAGACTVVEYYNVAHYGGAAGSAGTWEAILYASGDLRIQFLDPGIEVGSGSTTGIENNNAPANYGLTYACDTANSLTPQLALLFSVPLAPNLNHSYKSAPAKVEAAVPIIYTIHIVNTGLGPANNATVVDPIPAGTTYNGDVACSSGTCWYDSGTIYWAGVVPALGDEWVNFSVTPSQGCGETVVNEAVINDPQAIAPVTVSASTEVVGPIYYMEDFESGDGGYVNMGTNPFIYGTPPQNAPHSGLYGWATPMPYAASAWYELWSPWIDLSNANPIHDLRLQWWQDIYIESATYDKAYVEITTDGNTWAIVWQHSGGTYHSPGWEHKSFDITPYIGQTVRLRFRMTTDTSVQYDGWAIDDIAIHEGCQVFLYPDIEVQPEALSATLCPDQTETQTLHICNTGDWPLAWQLSEIYWPKGTESVLWDNGPMITHPGGGFNGSDASALQTALGMSVYGFGHQYSLNYWVADDFTVTDPAGWALDQITFYAYQTGSYGYPPVSTMTGVYYQILDGQPGAGGTVICGDAVTNRMTGTGWSGIYRVLDTNMLNSERPIMADTASIAPGCEVLPPGTYWIMWASTGTLGSGPWAPPITILGQTTTGNALQTLDGGVTWAALLDSGTNTQQGLPFLLEGEVAGPPPDLPWLSEDPLAGTVEPGQCQEVTVTYDTTGLAPGTYTGALKILSDDPDEPRIDVPVTLEVIECGAEPLHINRNRIFRHPGAPGVVKITSQWQVYDQYDQPVPGAVMAGEWTQPDGTVVPGVPFFGATDDLGREKFQFKNGGPGLYQFCVTGIIKAGYWWDPNDPLKCVQVVVLP